MLSIMLVFAVFPASSANAETRKLKLYYLHTGEKAEITFKKNGRYVKSGLKKINYFLRDWRKNEPTKMNPELLDLIWEVYKETKSRKHIHVISGYRSPATNKLLRKRGRGVAKKSQHTLGNALDFFIPGVSLTTLRNIGLRKGIGGVGFYPRSGSPFVHMDTGRVRHWPRMNRKQLVRVFPKGRTLHVPTDGKPLPGYNVAKANYERKVKGRGRVSIASAEEIQKKPSLLAKLFARNQDDDEAATSVSAAPKRVKSKTVKPAKAITPTVKPVAKPAEIVLPTPVPTPEVTPELPVTPEVVLASLSPAQIPVPISAPRIAIVKPTEPEVVETVVASLEPVEEQIVEVETQEQALVVPVPAQRPAFATQETAILAPVAEPQSPPRPSVEVAALSPNEITDLRQQVYATLEAPVKPTTIPFKPATQIVAADASTVLTAETIPFKPATKLEKDDVPSLIQSASSAINQQIAGIESNAQTTGRLGVPSTKPAPSTTLVTALLPAEPVPQLATLEPAPTLKYTVPVPQKATRTAVKKEIEIATAEPIIEVAQPKKTAPVAAISIQEFKTANLDKRLAGKWALATDASIKDIADIQPPAYGKNLIRKSPSDVLSRGFGQDSLGKNTSSFSGSSLEFLDFTKLKQ